MFKELKNSIKKLLSDEFFVGAIIFMTIVPLLILTLSSAISSLNNNDLDLKARCKSIEGKYGKGKCYVKGVEK